MASSTNKGNISTLMAVIAITAIVVLVGILAELMITDGVRAGKYNNPNVATQVLKGSIYDRNGRALALEVPQNNIYINTETKNPDVVSQVLSITLDTTPDVILSKIGRSDSTYVTVAKDVDSTTLESISEEIRKNNLQDDILIRKEYARVYPAAFHAAQLISETESALGSFLDPNPGYDEHTTYGDDVYLTMDLDIQYLLDLAVQQVYEIQAPDYSVAFILDMSSGDLLASTTYPFYDLNDDSEIPEAQKMNRTFFSSIIRPEVRISTVNIVDRVVSHNGNEKEVTPESLAGYTCDVPAIRELLDNPDGYTALLARITEEHPQYLMFIASVNPKYYQVSSILEYAVTSLEQGLMAQGKLY